MSDQPAEQMRRLLREAELDEDKFHVWLNSDTDCVRVKADGDVGLKEVSEWRSFRREYGMLESAKGIGYYVAVDELKEVID
jgi:hypothetical protein